MQNTRSHSSHRWRTALISVGLIGLTLAGILGYWWSSAMRVPVVSIPTPVMPNPNAFDFYVAAGKAVVNDKQIGDAFGSKPKVVYAHTQKEALVRSNLGVINTIHQGFTHPYLNPPGRSFDTQFPYFSRFRALSRLMSLQAQARAEGGDWSGAVESNLDAVRMGSDIPYGSALIGSLVGIACQAIGRKPMWDVVDHLNLPQSHAAIDRLTTIMERQCPYVDTLQEEKWAMQASLLELFREPKKLHSLLGDKKEETQGLSNLSYLIFSKSRIMGNYTNYMDQLMVLARQPYGLHLPAPPIPSDPFNKIIMPVFAQARLKDIDNRTQNGLLLVTLALHAFQLEHGHYPAALTELAPAYLKSLPQDPFGKQGTFQYHLQGRQYVLYSVGPDGKDDGGVPIDDPQHAESPDNTNPDARYFVNQDSRGDVVAGKNRY